MWTKIEGFIPPGMILFCAFLSAAIPLLVYTINQRLHAKGDPPWKKQTNTQQAKPPKKTAGQAAEQAKKP